MTDPETNSATDLGRREVLAGMGTGVFLAALPTLGQAKTSFKLEEASIEAIQAAVASGTLSYKKLVQLYLARINAYDQRGPKINCVITLSDQALALAEALDNERKTKGLRSPLHGIPVLLKDNVDTHDMPTSNGSAILKNSIPPDDAFLCQRLREAGAIIMGKVAMGEFAGGSYNSVIGQTVNPYHLKRHTGGSSAGSGAAIAANFAVLSIGTDTSTSVRGPSSYNGIVGLRPTTGLISRDGVAPKNLNYDSAGPMARSVTDMAKMLSVVAGPDAAENVRRRWGGTQLYIPKGHEFEITRKHLAVWDDFTGDNHNELAMKHGIGYQQVCRIIREMRAQQVRLRQRDIFDDGAGRG